MVVGVSAVDDQIVDVGGRRRVRDEQANVRAALDARAVQVCRGAVGDADAAPPARDAVGLDAADCDLTGRERAARAVNVERVAKAVLHPHGAGIEDGTADHLDAFTAVAIAAGLGERDADAGVVAARLRVELRPDGRIAARREGNRS